MGYQMVNEGGVMNVYWMSSCEPGSEIGKLYNGEVFTCIGVTTGYQYAYTTLEKPDADRDLKD